MLGQHTGDVLVHHDDFIDEFVPLPSKHPDGGRTASDTHSTFGDPVDDGSPSGLNDQMSAAFVNFARTGDPNGAAIPAWEKYDLPRRATLVINETSRMVDDPRKAERELFAAAPFLKEGT